MSGKLYFNDLATKTLVAKTYELMNTLNTKNTYNNKTTCVLC